MSPEQERWAEAVAIQQLHGDRAHIHVAEQVGTSALAGDAAGAARWRAIAERLDAIVSPAGRA